MIHALNVTNGKIAKADWKPIYHLSCGPPPPKKKKKQREKGGNGGSKTVHRRKVTLVISSRTTATRDQLSSIPTYGTHIIIAPSC